MHHLVTRATRTPHVRWGLLSAFFVAKIVTLECSADAHSSRTRSCATQCFGYIRIVLFATRFSNAVFWQHFQVKRGSMSMLEAKVTVGNDHTPSEDTVSRANALKDEGNKLLQGKSVNPWRNKCAGSLNAYGSVTCISVVDFLRQEVREGVGLVHSSHRNVPHGHSLLEPSTCCHQAGELWPGYCRCRVSYWVGDWS